MKNDCNILRSREKEELGNFIVNLTSTLSKVQRHKDYCLILDVLQDTLNDLEDKLGYD